MTNTMLMVITPVRILRRSFIGDGFGYLLWYLQLKVLALKILSKKLELRHLWMLPLKVSYLERPEVSLLNIVFESVAQVHVDRIKHQF